MKALIALEELAKMIACYLATLWLGYSWWLFWALLLLPDLSMIGYLINTRAGAWVYNLVHHQAIAIIIGIIGIAFHQPVWLLTAIILFGHSAMDRMCGYGLKHEDSFHHTHLGYMGKKQQVTGNVKDSRLSGS